MKTYPKTKVGSILKIYAAENVIIEDDTHFTKICFYDGTTAIAATTTKIRLKYSLQK